MKLSEALLEWVESAGEAPLPLFPDSNARYVIEVTDPFTGERLAESNLVTENEAEELYEFAESLVRELAGNRRLRICLRVNGSSDPRMERCEEILGAMAASA